MSKQKNKATVYIVASMAMSQDRSYSVMSKIVGAHWDESHARDRADYEKLGEIEVNGRKFKQQTTVFKVDVPFAKQIKTIYVVYNNGYAKDGTGACGVKLTGVFSSRAEANRALEQTQSGDMIVQGIFFEVTKHLDEVEVS